VNVPCIRAGGCTERCNPSTLSVGCSPTRKPTRVTTRTPAVGYNPGWVDPPVTALVPVSQYGRPPLAFRQLGSHCCRQCRQVESASAGTARQVRSHCRHGTAEPQSHFFCRQCRQYEVNYFTSRQFAVCRHASLTYTGSQYEQILVVSTFHSSIKVPLPPRAPFVQPSSSHCRLPTALLQAHPLVLLIV
jgi:hypothetical protein